MPNANKAVAAEEADHNGLSEMECMMLMAQLEVSLRKGEHVNVKISEATGLTRDQVKLRRARAVYRQYLEAAKKDKVSRPIVPNPAIKILSNIQLAPPALGNNASHKIDEPTDSVIDVTDKSSISYSTMHLPTGSPGSPISPMFPMPPLPVVTNQWETTDKTAQQPSPAESASTPAYDNPSPDQLPRITRARSRVLKNDDLEIKTDLAANNSKQASLNGKTSEPEKLKCPKCERLYATKSGLAKHAKTCGVRDRTKCQACGLEFTTFTGLRLHEVRAHPNLTVAAPPPLTEMEYFELMAHTEVRLKRGEFINIKISEVTGLSKDQIRHRRAKPIYQGYLENARREYAEEAPEAPKSITDLPRQTIYAEAVPVLPVASSPGQHFSQIPGSSKGIPVFTHDDPPSDDSDTETYCALPPLQQRQPLVSELRIAPSAKGKSIPGKPTMMKNQPATNAGTDDVTAATVNDDDARLPSPLLQYFSQLQADLELLPSGLTKDKVSSIINLARHNPTRQNFVRELERWVLSELGPRRQRTTAGVTHRGKNEPHYGQSFTGNGPRASRYKKTQDLYKKDRRGLADRILRGDSLDSSEVYPTIEATEEYFRNTYKAANISAPPLHTRPQGPSLACNPITADEVAEAKLAWHHSAPGPDGITTSSLHKYDNIPLAVLLSTILLGNIQLDLSTQARTTLVHKKGPRSDPGNWRPITISSALVRLLHRVLARRLSTSTNLCKDQRGFVQVDGTLANCVILDTFIKSRKAQRKSFSVVSIDIAKAFDTVPHDVIWGALSSRNFDETTIKYISANLCSTTTRVKVGQGHTNPIRIMKGVKQGDPLSPLLFNLVLDELLDKMNTKYQTASLSNDVRLSAIAFADDLILMADDPVEMPRLITHVTSFLQTKGMAINPTKCYSITYVKEKGHYYPLERPTIKIGGVLIQAVSNTCSFKYLGHGINAGGLLRPSAANLERWLHNIQKACLKPQQRLALIKDFVIPKLLYGLQNTAVEAQLLTAVDRQIRAAVKRALHLNVHTPDAALHGSIKHGGLGVMDMRSNIPYILKKRLLKLRLATDDTALQAALNSEIMLAQHARIERLAGAAPPSQEWRDRIAAAPTIKGLEMAEEDAASRSWLTQVPRGWSGRDYVRAVQLRSNNLPTVGLPYNPQQNRFCRAGCNKIESISHVLQQCPLTHHERIRRHNEIARKVANFVRPRHQVDEEPHVRHTDGTLFKPDLAIHMPSEVLIVDVGVNWEGNVTLARSHSAKKAVYDNVRFREAAALRWPNKTISVDALILGARGIWPRCNTRTERLLELTGGIKSSCVHSTLKWASSIHAQFNRAVWRVRNRRR